MLAACGSVWPGWIPSQASLPRPEPLGESSLKGKGKSLYEGDTGWSLAKERVTDLVSQVQWFASGETKLAFEKLSGPLEP